MDVPLVLMLGLAATVGLGFLIIVRRSPRVGLIAFLLTLSFVPIWVEVNAVLISLSLVSAVGAGTAVALVTRRYPQRWSIADLLMSFVFISSLAPVLLGRISLNAALVVIFVWGTAYLLGRTALLNVRASDLYSWTSLLFGAVAVLAVVEFVSGWHGLSEWGPRNANRAVWGTIQQRGGLARAEGAFGHSIALGAVLSMGAVLTVEARFRRGIRLTLIALFVVGAAVTLSRLGLICSALGLVICVVFPPSERARELRAGLVALLAVGAAVLLPLSLGVLSDAGSEATGSASYRGNLLSLLPYIDLLGTTAAAYTAADGTRYIGPFKSIDSQLLIFGLTYGWMTLACVVVLLSLAVVVVLRSKADAATISVVAQIPALATVALITQYAVFFWFTVGLAIAGQELRARERSQDLGSASRPLGSAVERVSA